MTTAQIIPFPYELAHYYRDPLTLAEPATVIILPVVRVESYPEAELEDECLPSDSQR